MQNFRQKHPIWLSIIVLLLTLVFSFAGMGVMLIINNLIPDFASVGEYGLQLIAELIMLACLVLLTFLLDMGHIFREKGAGFFRSLIPAGVILAYYLYAGLVSAIMSMHDPLQPPLTIVCYVLCMVAIGLTEELAFRGLITRMIFDKYGSTRAGVWLTVVVSGIIFGAMHLTNAAGGVIPLSGVLIQVIGAASLGMCLGAIYIRCQNLWAVAFIHAFMDLCALVSSGFFTSSSIADTLAGYSPIMLVSALIYGGIAAILLRKSKLIWISPEAKSPLSTKIKLIISLLLLILMATAVIILTI